MMGRQASLFQLRLHILGTTEARAAFVAGLGTAVIAHATAEADEAEGAEACFKQELLEGTQVILKRGFCRFCSLILGRVFYYSGSLGAANNRILP
jgi:hypothetical protein